MGDPGYFEAYENLAMSRDDGVLTVRFHTDGGPVTFTGKTHTDFPHALQHIAHDPGNRAMVLTGTGDAFIDDVDVESLRRISEPSVLESTRNAHFKTLEKLLELHIPVIGVANGPATVHAEYLLLTDIHIASERAAYGISRAPWLGVTGGDGLDIVWQAVVGLVRTKWLMWSRETIDAATAQQWGIVNEVVPHQQAYDRGVRTAARLAGDPNQFRRQKQGLNQLLERSLNAHSRFGAYLETSTAADAASRQGPPIRGWDG
jgi:enoyl-CoA hydratase/carnithine racemase